MAETSERADSYIRTLARVVAPAPNADTARANFYSRMAAHWEEQARCEARRADRWRATALYALSAAIFFLGALRGADWILAAGVFTVVTTVAIQQGREWR